MLSGFCVVRGVDYIGLGAFYLPVYFQALGASATKAGVE